MGDNHNLFGRLHEVHVFSNSFVPSGFLIEEFIRETKSSEILSTIKHNLTHMTYILKSKIDQLIKGGETDPQKSVDLVDFYEDCLDDYTYLE